MEKIRIGSIFAAAYSMIVTPVKAAQRVKQNPPHSVVLIELYAAERCSSCPPADRWVSGIDRDEYGIDRLIPLALHVDYWDQLGWKDRFASARYWDRPSTLSDLAQSRAIYAPEMFLNARKFRNWRSPARFQHAVRKIDAKPASADIRLELDTASPAKLPIKASFTLKPGPVTGQPQAFIAVYDRRIVLKRPLTIPI